MKFVPMAFDTEAVENMLKNKKTIMMRPITKTTRYLFKHAMASGKLKSLSDPSELDYILSFSPISVGDQIYVKEQFKMRKLNEDQEADYLINKANYQTPEYCLYKAVDTTSEYYNVDNSDPWEHAMCMHKWASRIKLNVTHVFFKKLHNTTIEEQVKFGFSNQPNNTSESFADIWDQTYKNWKYNPYVWIYEFEVIKGINKKTLSLKAIDKLGNLKPEIYYE